MNRGHASDCLRSTNANRRADGMEHVFCTCKELRYENAQRKAIMNTILIVLPLDHVTEWPIHRWDSAKPSLGLIMDVI